jgi:hypothetical protein
VGRAAVLITFPDEIMWINLVIHLANGAGVGAVMLAALCALDP